MLSNTPDPYKNISKVFILDAKKTFYPLRYFLQGRDLRFDALASSVLEVELLPEDIDYPADIKETDAGHLFTYKVGFTVNNQSPHTEASLPSWQGRKVILVLDYGYGRMIIGCNDMPMRLTYNDVNTSNPANNNTYYISCAGNTLKPKVIR